MASESADRHTHTQESCFISIDMTQPRHRVVLRPSLILTVNGGHVKSRKSRPRLSKFRLTFPLVRYPTSAGPAKPGIVAPVLVIPRRIPAIKYESQQFNNCVFCKGTAQEKN